MTDVLGVQLFEHEERCAVIRADVCAMLPKFLFGVAWLMTPFFFLFPLLRLGLFGAVFGGLLVLGAVAYLLNLRASWYGTALVVTTLRVIDVSRRGTAPPTVVAVPWREVTAVRVVSRSVWHALLGLGAIRIDFHDARPFAFVCRGVRNPESVQRLLLEVQCLTGKEKRKRSYDV